MMLLPISSRCCPRARGCRQQLPTQNFGGKTDGKTRRKSNRITTSKGPIQDLREWLQRVEELGDLVHVKEAVSCEEEMSAIGYLVAKQKPSPAILFDNIKGYEKSPYKARSLWNILGPSIPRIALTMEEPADTPTVELIRRVKDKLKNRMAPREVAASQADSIRTRSPATRST